MPGRAKELRAVRSFTAVVATLVLASAVPHLAVAADREKKVEIIPRTETFYFDVNAVPQGKEVLGEVRIVINQAQYAGLPGPRNCRLSVTISNPTNQTIEFFTLIRTADIDKKPTNSWMVPSGMLKSSELSSRVYLCQVSGFVTVDLQDREAWPKRCLINGKERLPCPINLSIESNLPPLPKEEAQAAKKEGS